MKRETTSLRRRQLMIAGLAAAAAPAAAALSGTAADRAIQPRAGETIVLSGRIVAPDGGPLPHIGIALAGGGERTLSDADGRFLLQTAAPAGRLDCRIAGRSRALEIERSAWLRDDRGVWRATVSLVAA